MSTPPPWPPPGPPPPAQGAIVPAHLPRDADTFSVEELPLYPLTGEGEHLFVEVERRGLSFAAMVAAVAARLAIPPKVIGSAGIKDTHATARQWLSVPQAALAKAGLAAADLPSIDWHPRMRVVQTGRHRHRLRTGHLAGNRFVLTVRLGPEARGVCLARRLAHLAEVGMPNAFGPQRFGPGQANVAAGRQLLLAGTSRPGRMPGWRRRLLLSAVQAAAFNGVLWRRWGPEVPLRVASGDVMRRRASGGLFCSSEPAVDQARHDAHELDIAGPIFGPKMVAACGAPQAAEAAALADLDLAADAFDRPGSLTQGTRRALRVVPGEASARAEDADTWRLAFTLPPGAYATVLLWALGLVEAPGGKPAATGAPT